MPIAAAITGVTGLAGTIYGGIKAGQERKKMEQYLQGQQTENDSWYNSNFHGDYLQRSDTQALMKNLRDNLKTQTKRTESTAAITGATPEAQSVAKENANRVITDTYSRLGAMGQQWKDRVTDRYLQRKDLFANQAMGMMEGSAQGYENLMSNSLSGMMSGLTSTLSPKTVTQPAKELWG
jgi:hypothetical protein